MRDESEIVKEIERINFHGRADKYRDFNGKAMSTGMTDEQIDWIIATRHWYMYQALRFALGYEYEL